MFLLALVMHAVNDAFDGVNPLIMLAAQFAAVAPYMFLALRRVYGEPGGRTAWKTAVLLLLAFLLDIPVNIAALQLSIGLT